jgi:hypothetical protein
MPRRKKSNSSSGCGIIVLIIILLVALPYIYPYIIALLVGAALFFGIKWFAAYSKRNNEQKLALKRQEEYAEYQKVFEERKRLFLESPDYQLIQQFSQKFKSNASDEDIYKLGSLLQKRKWNFSQEELGHLLIFEENRQESNAFKNRILALEPKDFEDYLRSYIEVCGSSSDRLPLLAELLHSSGVYPNPDMQALRREVSGVNHQIELEAFENRLLSGSEHLTLAEVDNLNGYEFEDFLKKLFSRMGYQVEQTRLSGDQGADLVVVKFGEKTVIQAKRYSGKVGNYAVQEIMAAISLYQAQKGMVVTNSYFTPAAVELARANRIELIDRDALKNLVERYW